jgi:predicted protein tyrosine phosphatase
VVCVFARKTSEPLASLVKQIDQKIGENPSLCSFVVIMSKEPGKTPEELRKLAQDEGIKHVPLTMFGDPEGPGQYDLSRKADITVLMWTGHKVKVNRAYKGELTDKDVRTIVADIPKLLGN